jgi:hypothetical protein
MDATPISFDTATPLDGPSLAGFPAELDFAAEKWTALHNAAFIVATLAGAGADTPQSPLDTELQAFPAQLSAAPGWLREIAEQGVDDLAAIMEPGLAALIAVHGAGSDAAAPARALWHEFAASRDALLRLMRPLA